MTETIFHIVRLDELVVKGQTVNESRRGTEVQQPDLCVRLQASCFCQVKSTYYHALNIQIYRRLQYSTYEKVQVTLLKPKSHANLIRSKEDCGFCKIQHVPY